VSISLSKGIDPSARRNCDGLFFLINLDSPVLLLVLIPKEIYISHDFSSGHEVSVALSGFSNSSKGVSSGFSSNGLNQPVLQTIAIVSEPIVDIESTVVGIRQVRSFAS
jgi:hypothetical protein